MLCNQLETERHLYEFRVKVEEICCSYASYEQKKASLQKIHELLLKRIMMDGDRPDGQRTDQDRIRKYQEMLVKMYGSVEAADKAMLAMMRKPKKP